MKNDLKERYIYAVTKKLPEKIRQDVSDELETLIEDMLLERCGASEPTEKDLRIVLTELGTPRELYEKYTDTGKDCLIGFPYYSDYKAILKIVIISGVIGTFVVSVLSEIVNPSGAWYNAITKCIEPALDVIPSAFMLITLVFAFCYHNGIDINLKNDFDFDKLPPVPDKNKKISRVDPILGIVFPILFFIVFMFAPQILGIGFIKGEGVSDFIPAFSTEAIHSSWLFIVIITVCGVVREAIRLIEGRECKSVMISTIVANTITIVTSSIWLLGTDIMNPVVADEAAAMFANDQIVLNILSNFQIFILAIIVFASLLEIAVTTVKTLKK
ncbi:MAG: hypothetical protein UE295_08670 [Acutalibacteraceae bacterium]|nr:hypothetical protein [Acutalibacteraceae bacterium]